jgi:hypothetical protein
MNLRTLFCTAAALSVSFVPFASAAAKPVSVQAVKRAGSWTLLVDDQPFYIKGIACNEAMGEKGEDFLKLVADAGANTVRVYGDVTKDYLDRAQQYGLKVDVGFWFNAIRLGTKESYRNVHHRQTLKKEALAYIRKFKNHPAVLAWTLGNEVFSFTSSDEEKEAFGMFLEDVVQAAHREDSHHPVIYASSHTRCLPFLKKWVPSIDIVGVNVTGGAGAATHWAAAHSFDRPVIVTEFAPLGSWEQRKDPNGASYDPLDQMKAENLLSSWRQIQANPKTCIGGFAFVMGGFRNQDSLTWYNMNYGLLKRASYWTIYELYTGKKPLNQPPKISMLSVTPISGIKKGGRIEMHVEASDPEGSALAYDYFVTNIAKDPLLVEKPTFYPADPKPMGPGTARVRVPNAPGLYRVYASVTDGHGNIAIADRSILVSP